jgi:hypothetical protein
MYSLIQVIDTGRIERICSHNMFSGASLCGQLDETGDSPSSGLWPLASFMNHACTCNRVFIFLLLITLPC